MPDEGHCINAVRLMSVSDEGDLGLKDILPDDLLDEDMMLMLTESNDGKNSSINLMGGKSKQDWGGEG